MSIRAAYARVLMRFSPFDAIDTPLFSFRYPLPPCPADISLIIAAFHLSFSRLRHCHTIDCHYFLSA